MKPFLKALLVLLGLVALSIAAAFVWIGSRGISARAEPGRVETAVARTMRRLAVPRRDRDRTNPIALTAEVLKEGMAHFADHCAACHANNGSGETAIGLGLYPRPPDMRLPATQSLSDGELFYIIENGVRLTGMPAWGTGKPDQAEETWHLVHFIRRLPKLSDDELEEMKGLNPKSADERREDEEARRFLEGGAQPAVKPPVRGHTHGRSK
jgi:mono/diheme cytochrome c family protein